jgi:hypothetical protein
MLYVQYKAKVLLGSCSEVLFLLITTSQGGRSRGRRIASRRKPRGLATKHKCARFMADTANQMESGRKKGCMGASKLPRTLGAGLFRLKFHL